MKLLIILTFWSFLVFIMISLFNSFLFFIFSLNLFIFLFFIKFLHIKILKHFFFIFIIFLYINCWNFILNFWHPWHLLWILFFWFFYLDACCNFKSILSKSSIDYQFFWLFNYRRLSADSSWSSYPESILLWISSSVSPIYCFIPIKLSEYASDRSSRLLLLSNFYFNSMHLTF